MLVGHVVVEIEQGGIRVVACKHADQIALIVSEKRFLDCQLHRLRIFAGSWRKELAHIESLAGFESPRNFSGSRDSQIILPYPNLWSTFLASSWYCCAETPSGWRKMSGVLVDCAW